MGNLIRVSFGDNRARAYELYSKATQLDEHAKTWEAAADLYRQAIKLDPTLAVAYTNLGNVLFRCGKTAEAERVYLVAAEIDPRQPEASYNLGYCKLDRGLPLEAVEHFRQAVFLDPRFADAHFNLAMALEQVAEHEAARQHWARYLELEPKGTWAEVARKHLAAPAGRRPRRVRDPAGEPKKRAPRSQEPAPQPTATVARVYQLAERRYAREATRMVEVEPWRPKERRRHRDQVTFADLLMRAPSGKR